MEETTLLSAPIEENPASNVTEPTTEVKTEEVKTEQVKAPVVPEKYEDFKLPEGVEVDAEMLDAFKPLAKELGLTQENAQKLVDLQAKASQKMAEANAKAWTTMVEKWANDAKADKEYGGVNFNENIGVARKALDHFGTPALKAMLNETGVGNHPELIKFAIKVGKEMQSGGVLVGGKKTEATDIAHILYPNLA